MIRNGNVYVAIYEDIREANPCRVFPAICGGDPGDTIVFANHMDEEVVLDFPRWPFDSGSSPITLSSKSTVSLTLGAKVLPGDVYPYNVKCCQGRVMAEGSRPIIIVYA